MVKPYSRETMKQCAKNGSNWYALTATSSLIHSTYYETPDHGMDSADTVRRANRNNGYRRTICLRRIENGQTAKARVYIRLFKRYA